MIDYKIYKKDLKKNKTDKIIVTVWEGYNKKYYIITTLQAIEDYKKTGFLAYDTRTHYKTFALALLEELNNKNKELETLINNKYKNY